MSWLHFLLNMVGLLLWLNWRAARLRQTVGKPGNSLLVTLKRTETLPPRRWVFLAVLAAVLLVRAWFYWNLGDPLNYTPMLDMGPFNLVFRSDFFSRMVLFSLVSFGLVIAWFYHSLLLLSLLHRRTLDMDDWHRTARWHLGWIDRWPWWLKFPLPLVVTCAFWLAASRGLVNLGLLPPPKSPDIVWIQALTLAGRVYLSWKYIALGVLGLHVLNSYVYMGNQALWAYAKATARILTRPLASFQMQVWKIDCAPLAIMGLIWALDYYGDWGLEALYFKLLPQ